MNDAMNFMQLVCSANEGSVAFGTTYFHFWPIIHVGKCGAETFPFVT